MTRKKTVDEPVETEAPPPPPPIDPQTINPGSSFEKQPEGFVAIVHPDLNDVVSFVTPESLPGWRDAGWMLLNEDGTSEPIPDDPPPPPPPPPAATDADVALPGPPEGFVTIVHPDLPEGSNTGYVHPDSLSVYGPAGWQLQTDDGVEDIAPAPEPDPEPADAGDEPEQPPVEEEPPTSPDEEE